MVVCSVPSRCQGKEIEVETRIEKLVGDKVGMFVTLMKSKIHRATVTRLELDYEDSIVIDDELLELPGRLPGEAVHVWNVNNGHRCETYAVPSSQVGRNLHQRFCHASRGGQGTRP